MTFTMTLAAVSLQPGNWLAWLIAGGLAGWIAGRLMGGGYGFFGDIILGLIGAVVGGFISGLIFNTSLGFIGTLVVAVIGAVIVVALLHAVTGSSRARHI